MKKKILVVILALTLMISVAGCGAKKVKEISMTEKPDKIVALKADYEEDILEMFELTLDEMSSFQIDGDKAYMNGIISKDTIRQIKVLVTDYPDVKTIVMQKVPGSIDDESNLIASKLVRKAGLNTELAKDGVIESGGTDFFCAGVERQVLEGGKIGIHSWADEEVQDASLLPKDDKAHKPYIEYYKEMELPDPEGLYFLTITAAKANGMYFMTNEEIKKYGLTNK